MTPQELKAIEQNTMTAALAAWDKHNAPAPKQEALL